MVLSTKFFQKKRRAKHKRSLSILADARDALRAMRGITTSERTEEEQHNGGPFFDTGHVLCRDIDRPPRAVCTNRERSRVPGKLIPCGAEVVLQQESLG